MMEAYQQDLSQKMLTLKSGLGGLVELVDSWILSLEVENDRFKHLSALKLVLDNPDSGLKSELRSQCLDHLSCLLDGQNERRQFGSLAFRQKLKKLFEEQILKINLELDNVLKHVGRCLESLASETKPAGDLILAQEDERKRISREIHDGPAQSLASLTMRVDFCLDQIQHPDVLKKELFDLKDSIGRSLKDIRRFIFDLRPMALDDLGLIPTLEQFIAGFRTRTGIPTSFHVEGEKDLLGPDKELAVFRVVQEAVNNAGRHSQPRSIQVFLSFDRKTRRLNGVVKDDGRGFDVAALRKNYASLKKLGLLSMEERVKLAGGTFELISTVGSGTLVSFGIPLEGPKTSA